MKHHYFHIPIGILLLVNLVTLCDFRDPESDVTPIDGEKTVGILPFEDFPQREIDSVKKSIENYFDLEVTVLDAVDLPRMAYTEIRYPRYRADSLLEWMSVQPYDDVDIVLGLTKKDISITKYEDVSRTNIKDPEWKYKDFGIFGLGRLGGETCIISSYRLSENVSKTKYFQRLTRITCHELGHVLGLPHCVHAKCLMNDANESITTIDNSTGELCQECWNKIKQ